MTMSNLLAGKTALVLGVANKWSLAYAIAQAFTREGARLILTYQGERVKQTVEELGHELKAARLFACDVQQEQQIGQLTQSLRDDGGRLDAVAKAALEATVRYLASDLGPQQIRVNAISSGPVKTTSARGIKDFSKVLEGVAQHAPLRRNTDPAEVADAAVFLASDLGRGVTGNILFVDAGFQIMGL